MQRLYTDPFGAARGASDAGTVPGDTQFLGKTRDTSTGLTLLGARYYDEALGRFISVDPLLDPGLPAQFNAYVYAANNPHTWADPSGLFWGDMWNNIGNAVGTAGKAVGGFVDKYQAEIVGAVVGIGVTIGCTVATGGAGVIGCAVLGGAAGGAVTNLWKTQVTKREQFTWSGFAADVGIGMVGGLVGGAAGVGLSKALTVAAPAAKQALNAVSTALRNTTSRTASSTAATTQRVTQSIRLSPQKPTSGASCAFNSFVPGTTVLMADGSEVPIEEVGLGDVVWASDPVSGESAPREVVRLITGDGVKDLVTVTVADEGGVSGSVVATAGHPFWVPDAGAWVDAGQLRAGQWLQTSAGTWVQITAVAHERRVQTVHNLTVAVDHTYYVAAGDLALLTHNTNCGGGAGSAGARLSANAAAGNTARDSIAAANSGSRIEQSLSTAFGARRIDVLTRGGVGIESKVGRTYLTSATRSQIAKDSWLLQNEEVAGIHWVFSRSAATGRIGPSGPLADALRNAGIPWSLGR
ncbi:hypothetical protein ARHIZOSPH14_21540 [Agromyces rhizosphaerae]|uniref:Hint domain-containing protein n=1 Tax=Agromyces rhizosphaerae TaxID=88374 RepID=A0A9W6CWL5_9MICO|nr:RHS repeat-associated core domain-containing protein [Agromyces rhizosphaerae]GLI27912.1 hypothetical protein ARHIZOSPH14_21540 [Agromyces rhizosphaerae]